MYSDEILHNEKCLKGYKDGHCPHTFGPKISRIVVQRYRHLHVFRLCKQFSKEIYFMCLQDHCAAALSPFPSHLTSGQSYCDKKRL